ncbi:MAG: universal stress protein [Deltaproteobacteria bacterium]|nr:MAG: universal stress protein [Deltaproteobacteria bacterium]
MRILVPIDFSVYSWETLRYAMGLRELLEPVLVLLHVLPPPDDSLSLFGPLDTDRPERESRLLERLRNEVEAHLPDVDPPEVHYRVASGVPFKEICRVADAEKVEMILIGTHGRTGLSHLLIGSTAERVVQHASCPVLSIRPKLL